MAGAQNPFQSGFANSPSGTMRSQFGTAAQIPSLMASSPQAASGMVMQQPYGQIQTQPPQQLGQPLQPSSQPQQQQQQQQQQTQQQQPQQTPQSKELNTASLCRIGQETVQDIVSRTQEVFQALKQIQPPNGTPQGLNTSTEKKAKVQDQLNTIRLLFKRLRLIYAKCNENCQGMEYTHIESLIPLKEEWDMKSDEKKSSEAYRLACEENKEIMEQVILKNRHLKEIIDHLRRIIWEINTMLTMRRS